jgi:hypothetical protein
VILPPLVFPARNIISANAPPVACTVAILQSSYYDHHE